MNYKERGPSSLIDNLSFMHAMVSHVEINRFFGTSKKMGYQVVCKSTTIDPNSGEKCFVIWAVEEGYDGLEILIQKAKDDLDSRINSNNPIINQTSPSTLMNWQSYSLAGHQDIEKEEEDKYPYSPNRTYSETCDMLDDPNYNHPQNKN